MTQDTMDAQLLWSGRNGCTMVVPLHSLPDRTVSLRSRFENLKPNGGVKFIYVMLIMDQMINTESVFLTWQLFQNQRKNFFHIEVCNNLIEE